MHQHGHGDSEERRSVRALRRRTSYTSQVILVSFLRAHQLVVYPIFWKIGPSLSFSLSVYSFYTISPSLLQWVLTQRPLARSFPRSVHQKQPSSPSSSSLPPSLSQHSPDKRVPGRGLNCDPWEHIGYRKQGRKGLRERELSSHAGLPS